MVTAGRSNGGGVAQTLLAATLLIGHEEGVLPHAGFAGDGLALGGFIAYRDGAHALVLASAEGGLCLLCCGWRWQCGDVHLCLLVW